MGGLSSQVVWKQGGRSNELLFEVLKSLGCTLKELPSQKWNRTSGTVSGIRDYKLSYIAPGGPGWRFLLLHLNASVGEELARQLSAAGNTQAFVFFEQSRASWGYALFDHGKEADRFWNSPDDANRPAKHCRGNPAVLGKTFGRKPSEFEPYLRHLPPGKAPREKAFPDDEFFLNDHWVRVDFMKRVGIRYPDPGRTQGGKYILIQEPHTTRRGAPRAKSQPEKPKRPWWKFWSK